MIYLLSASITKEASDQNTVFTLNFLADQGYKISKGKAHISQPAVKYLGIELSEGERNLPDRREAPTTRRQLRRFLGMAGFCCIWIPNFGLIVKPLYESLKRNANEPLSWTAKCHESFHAMSHSVPSRRKFQQPQRLVSQTLESYLIFLCMKDRA